MPKSFTLAFALIILAGFLLLESKAVTVGKSLGIGANRGARKLIKSAYQGGKGGKNFDDLEDHDLGNDPILCVHSISISYRSKVDSIQVTYLRNRQGPFGLSLFKAPRHGIMKSLPTKITFGSFENIVRVEGQTDGKYVTQLTFITEGFSSGTGGSYRKVYGPFGKNGSTSFSLEGGFIISLFGRRGLLHLNSIGVYSMEPLKKSNAFGGTGGTPFDDHAEIIKPPGGPILGLSQIRIWSNEAVEGMILTYATYGSDYFQARQHGLQVGNLTTIDLQNGEVLVAVEGLTEDNYISQLTFTTQKPDGSVIKHGPFGETGKCPFSIFAKIVALYGTSDSRINTIGVFYVD